MYIPSWNAPESRQSPRSLYTRILFPLPHRLCLRSTGPRPTPPSLITLPNATPHPTSLKTRVRSAARASSNSAHGNSDKQRGRLCYGASVCPTWCEGPSVLFSEEKKNGFRSFVCSFVRFHFHFVSWSCHI